LVTAPTVIAHCRKRKRKRTGEAGERRSNNDEEDNDNQEVLTIRIPTEVLREHRRKRTREEAATDQAPHQAGQEEDGARRTHQARR
jgi:hypothetical protein